MHPNSAEASRIRAKCASRGKVAIFLPVGVKFLRLSNAPNKNNVLSAEATKGNSIYHRYIEQVIYHSLESGSGMSMKSRVSMSCPMHFSCSIFDVRLHRRISGSADKGSELNASSVYNLKQKPWPYSGVRDVLLCCKSRRIYLTACAACALHGR